MDFNLLRLDPDIARQDFTCGDPDLDEFYRVDSIESARQLMSVTYALIQDDVTVAFFSVSNDSIKTEDLPRSARERFLKPIPRPKRYKSMPAAKIGRIAVCQEKARCKIGTAILDYLKAWFTINNKTGCRFLLIDAYNKESVLKFYEKNDFKFFSTLDEDEETRIMYFDLALFKE